MVWEPQTRIYSYWSTQKWRKSLTYHQPRNSTFWKNVLKLDPMMESVCLCVELVFGNGETINVSTKAISSRKKLSSSVPGNEETVVYKPLLVKAPAIQNVVSMGGGSSSARSFTLNVSQLDIDVYSILTSRRFLAGYGEISLQVDGQWWEDRWVILKGDMNGGVRFGGEDEMIDLEIVDPKDIDDLQIPVVRLTTEDWPDMPENNLGYRIPMAINNVSTVPCVRVYNLPPSLGNDLAFVGFHSPLGQHFQKNAYVNGEEKNPGDAGYPYNISLGETQNVSFFQYNFVTGGTGVWEDSDTVYVPASIDGGESPDGTEITLIEVIRYLCVEWSTLGLANINEDMFSRAMSKQAIALIPSVLLNGSGNTNSATAIKYIEDVLCKSYPMVSMAWQDGGYGPVYYDRRVEPVMELRVGQYPLIKRRTAITETAKEELKNRFTINFDYDAMTDTHRGLITRDASNSTLCALSANQAGTREMDMLESKVIPSTASLLGAPDSITADWQANHVIDWYVQHYTLPSYYAEFDAFAAVYLQLALGDNVILYDETITKDPISATVEKISIEPGKAVLGLRMWILYDLVAVSSRSTN
jgi:hypothetical protein